MKNPGRSGAQDKLREAAGSQKYTDENDVGSECCGLIVMLTTELLQEHNVTDVPRGTTVTEWLLC